MSNAAFTNWSHDILNFHEDCPVWFVDHVRQHAEIFTDLSSSIYGAGSVVLESETPEEALSEIIAFVQKTRCQTVFLRKMTVAGHQRFVFFFRA